MVYTKKEFKNEWEKEDCAITFDDIADCAKAWGLYDKPRCCPILLVRYKVVKAAGCSDAGDYCQIDDEDDDY